MRTMLLLCLGLALAGCDAGPKRYTVSGEVTLDAEPIEEGNIVFLPPGTDSGGDGGRIEDGQYSCQVTPGAKRVRITADRRLAGKSDPTGMPRHEQYIPKHYNAATTLKADVERSQTLDFKLTSK